MGTRGFMVVILEGSKFREAWEQEQEMDSVLEAWGGGGLGDGSGFSLMVISCCVWNLSKPFIMAPVLPVFLLD
jgi:hypothetical protein